MTITVPLILILVLTTPIWEWPQKLPAVLKRFPRAHPRITELLIYLVCNSGLLITTVLLYYVLLTSPHVVAVGQYVLGYASSDLSHVPLIDYLSTGGTQLAELAWPPSLRTPSLVMDWIVDMIHLHGPTTTMLIVGLLYLAITYPAALAWVVWVRIWGALRERADLGAGNSAA